MHAKLPLALTIATTTLLTAGCHSSNDAATPDNGPTASSTTTIPEVTQTVSAIHEGLRTPEEEQLAADARRISSYTDEAVILRLSGSPAIIPVTLSDADAAKLVGFACVGPQNLRVEFLDTNQDAVSKSNIACRSAFTVAVPGDTSNITALRVKSIQGTITTVAIAGPVNP